MKETNVSVVWVSQSSYSETPPFHPGTRFPEYQGPLAENMPNSAYDGVRSAFQVAGLDAGRFGMADWNPLGDVLHPGDTVLLKPNLVKESHPRDVGGWRYVLTHGSVIRAVSDYVWKGLRGEGKIIVADAPQTDSSFSEIARLLGLFELRDYFRSLGVDFELCDLRQEEWSSRDGVIFERRSLEGDPRGYVAFNLGSRSEFASHSGAGRYYGADYDASVVNHHHKDGRHEYLIAGTAINADVIFSLPKLKTHKKAGITVTLKNLVGINGDKNWLPHHTEGDPRTGGDERPFLDTKGQSERSIVSSLRYLSQQVPGIGPQLHRWARRAGTRIFGDTEDVIRSGNWWGNDTTWRMCLDLNKIALYGQMDSTFRTPTMANRRRHYALVDGIIAGEGRGPMNPDPVMAGLIVFGTNPVSVDATCAYLMGFDPEKIPIVRQAFRCQHFPLANWNWQDVEVASNVPAWNGQLGTIPDDSTYRFEPHFGWKGHIERKACTSSESNG